MTKLNKALILAAGKGTRFLPYTKSYPKEMLPVLDRPALQLLVEEVVSAGISDVLIVISPEKQAIVRHFEKDERMAAQLRSSGKVAEAEEVERLNGLADVKFVYQNSPNGTGKAVMLARNWAQNQPFAVLNGDDVIFTGSGKSATAQLKECFESVADGKSIVGVQAVDRSVIHKYASAKVVATRGRLSEISDLVEKPQSDKDVFSLLAPLGRYVVSSDIFRYIEFSPERNGEVYLTDALQLQAREHGIYAYEFIGRRHDFGDKLGYIEGFTEYALQDPRFGEKYREFLEELLKK